MDKIGVIHTGIYLIEYNLAIKKNEGDSKMASRRMAVRARL